VSSSRVGHGLAERTVAGKATTAELERHPTPKLGALVGTVGLLLLGALVTSLPGVIVLSAPFCLVLLAALLSPAPAPPEVEVTLDRSRVFEGDTVTMTITLFAPELRFDAGTGFSLGLGRRYDVAALVPAGIDVPEAPRYAIRIRPNAPGDPAPPSWSRTISLSVRRFGSYELGRVALRCEEALGVYVTEGVRDLGLHLDVLPSPETVRTLVRQELVRATAGDRLARTPGDGIEFADLRPYAPGDRASRVNWRASARRGTLYVNRQHPERSTDVVVFVDTFLSATLADTLRVAARCAATYLEHQDRVGLICFGGLLQVIEPATGRRQLERIAAALIEVEAFESFAEKQADSIPMRLLPRSSLVIAVSALTDQRAINALAAIRGWGYELSVIEIPLPAPSAALVSSPSGRAAATMLALELAVRRDRMTARGIPVIAWSPEIGLEGALAGLASYRRAARRSGRR
jgi:uncharacterized protein (DUF58 family)